MLSVHLANIKSSGIYRFTFDKSMVVDQSVETLRLVVGYSEVGPFNTAMYVTSIAQFEELYGSGSKKLEKRGIYFHRLAKQCLSKTPIICLNLKKFENEALGMSSFDVVDDPTSTKDYIKVENVYDTARLWTLSPEKLVDELNTYMESDGTGEKSGAYSSKYITISATGDTKSSCSVIFKPTKASSYDITIAEWYAQTGEEMPEYLYGAEGTYVSDYFVKVYVFRGDLTKPASTLKDYFTSTGYTDSEGDWVSATLKMLDDNGYDNLDQLAEHDSSGYISTYTGTLLPYFYDLDGSDLSIDLKFNVDNTTHQMMMYLDDDLLEDGAGDKAVYWSDLNVSGLYSSVLDLSDFTVTCGEDEKGYFGENEFYINTSVRKYTFNSTKETYSYAIDETANNTYFYETSDIITYLPQTEIEGSDLTDIFTIGEGSDEGTFTMTMMSSKANDVGYCPVNTGDSLMIYVEEEGSNIGTLCTVLSRSLTETIEEGGDGYETNYGVTLTLELDGSDTVPAAGSDVVAVMKFTSRTKLTTSSEGTDFLYLEGYTYENASPTNTTMYQKKQWHSDILSTLTDYEGIYLALTSTSDLDYRYIVDTFEAYVEAGHGTTLSKLCKDKGNALLISNVPSMKSFAECPYTSFKDDYGVFKTDYIVTGGEGGERFSLPTEANGASFAAFYTPLKFADNSQYIYVPSAGLVSNNFMDKYTSRQPYYVVAGPIYGRMTYDNMVGPDFNYSQSDRDNLEPIGVNVMLYKPKRGTFINSNQTAKQVPVTALSKVNVRELVIYLQDTIASMLEGYHWEMNTTSLRAMIKSKADAICEQVLANGGLYAYYNQCDDSNNTAEVIDNEMLVLSTHIEPAKGAGKMVHELTIYNTGEMSSYIS